MVGTGDLFKIYYQDEKYNENKELTGTIEKSDDHNLYFKPSGSKSLIKISINNVKRIRSLC